MSREEHTPRPWTLESGASGTYEPGDDERHPLVTGPNRENPICIFRGDWEDEWENARLIAAAPDLLDALETAREAYETGDWWGWWKDAEAAIAKATGPTGETP